MTRILGRLSKVDLREVWMTEASDFTPWLARAENLGVLSETLGLELELEAQEQSVGPFRADILCKEVGTGRWVLVENQLERTDHNHLGQLLTYASGLEAVTIIWIAARFTEEHRASLDWLNRITDESFRFFGLEVELWRIGDSVAAPKFNIVSKPNDWSHSVAQSARAIDDAVLTETRILQREYWTEFNKVLDAVGGPVRGNKKPQAESWMTYRIGRANFWLAAAIRRQQSSVRAELYLSGEDAKAHFNILLKEKDSIEQELRYPLEWNELPTRRDSRIAVYLHDVDPEDRTDWPRQQAWLASHVNDLYRVFSQRVRSLDADDWRSGDADASPDASE